MTDYPKKQFFQEPTKSRILRVNDVSADDNLVDRIEHLEEGEALIIETKLIPQKFSNSRKFLKHGPEVKPTRVYTLEEVARNKFVPVQLREEAFNSIEKHAYCSYSFMPFTGKDQRKRKVSLVECVEAARIFAYAHNLGTGIEFKSYEESLKVESEGATIPVKIPSRRRKYSKYEFNLISVPVIDSKNKFMVSQGIGSSGHNCKRSQYSFRYVYEEDKESSRVFDFCAHEIAAYFEIINHYWKILKNIIPLEMSQFAIPTQRTIDYYKRLYDSVLMMDQDLTQDKLRKLNKAEKEILLWGFVHKYKHNETFFATDKLENYNWQLRNMD